MKKFYLGDDVYIEITVQGQVVLTEGAEGMRPDNAIYLYPETLTKLMNWCKENVVIDLSSKDPQIRQR